MSRAWLKPDEAAVALGISKATMYRMLRDGCPSLKTPKGVRVRPDLVSAWLRRRVVDRHLTR